MHFILLNYRGQSMSISVDGMTVGQLHAHIEQLYNIPASNQKLLYKGQILRAENSLVSAMVPSNSKVLLIGTPRAELAKFQEQMTRRQQGQINNAKYRANAASLYRTHDPLGTSDEYGFGSFEALPISHRQNEALSMLQKLARDQGVKEIMQKHKYRVGVLRELHPQERTILGYNRNRGQVIALRLRTDDLEGFRDYLNVRRVLMHELAHMVWDEHDENFHQLNRQHCKEVVDLDWSLRGRTVGTAMDYYEPQTDDAQNVDGGSLKSSGFVLGGTVPHLPADSSEHSPDAKRNLAYTAYKKRSSSSS
ncbi:WLM domain-containing protein [Coemansia mojavensis]|nr:WLM domain-containing protein [Coemansia mojavensis]